MKTKRQKTVFAMVALVTFLMTLEQSQAARVLFTPELTLSEEYSDNIFLTHEDEEDDYITTAGLNLTVDVLGRTSGLMLNYNPSHSSYANHSELNFWRHAGRLQIWKNLHRNTRLELTNDFLETEDPIDVSEDFTPEDPMSGPAIEADLNRRDRNRYRTNVTEGRFSHQFGVRDSVYTAMQYSFREDIDTVEGEPVDDYTNWRPSAGITYWFAQRWGVELDGYYSNRDYEDENDRQEYSGYIRLLHAFRSTLNGFIEYRHTALYYDEESDEDYQIYAPSAGITYHFQDTAHITIGAGYYIQDYYEIDDSDDDAAVDDDEGWFANSEIYKRWAFRSSYIELTGNSGYEIDDTGTEDLGLTIYYQGRLDIGHNFTSRFTASAYGLYRYDDHPNQEPQRTDKTANAGASIRYQLLQWMNLRLTYDHRNVSSDIEEEEYTENSVLFMITLSPSTAFRWN